MEADPRVTAHVAGLGLVVRGGDPDSLFLRIPGVVHVGQLRPPVFSEGDQYSLPLPGNQLSKPTLDHAARTTAGGPMFRPRPVGKARAGPGSVGSGPDEVTRAKAAASTPVPV